MRKDWLWYEKMDKIFGVHENIPPFLANKEAGIIKKEASEKLKNNVTVIRISSKKVKYCIHVINVKKKKIMGIMLIIIPNGNI